MVEFEGKKNPTTKKQKTTINIFQILMMQDDDDNDVANAFNFQCDIPRYNLSLKFCNFKYVN